MSDEYAMLLTIEILEREERRSLRRERVIRSRVDAFEIHDEHFRRLFRVSKELAKNLINDLKPYMKQPKRKSELSLQTKVLTALRFFASGSYQMNIAQDLTLAISQQSVSRCIKTVSTVLATHILEKWVKFPMNLASHTQLKQQ